GSWSGDCGLSISCTQDYLGTNTFVPSLNAVSNPNFPTQAFGDGPHTITVTPGAASVYIIRADLSFVITGNGVIDLPGSYDASAVAIPAPGAALLFMGMGGVLATRRRRGD